MKILNLEENNYEEIISEGLVLVDFYAEWCGPCKMFSPVLEKLALERNDLKILKVNIDQYTDLAQSHSIMSVPTLLLYKDGKVLSQKQGFLTIDMLTDWLNEAK